VGQNSTQNLTKRFCAALYMRLSREDGEPVESASIENQRKILRNYVSDNGLVLFREYIDDGYSGTNFERPAFQRMKADIAKGKIGVVLTKDFSRLGRNTGQVMTMLDDFFVRNGVRYISVTENIDTAAKDITGMLAPMLSFTNELYSGDISRKINASFAAKMRAGEYIGAFAPYGYLKDQKNKNHLLPDAEAANVVKQIFSLAKEGYSPRQIANLLNEEGVPTPAQYRRRAHIHLDAENCERLQTWKTGTVSALLRNEFYLGNTVQGKTHKPSFKSKYVETVPKSEWIRVENTHQALIDQDTWDIVRKRMQSRTQVRNKGFSNLFSGVAKCFDCGRNMSTAGTRKKGAGYNLNCGGYKQFGPKACSSHAIAYDALYQLVMESIKQQMRFTEDERQRLIFEVLQENRADTAKLDDAKKRRLAVSGKLAMAYDKHFSGDMDHTCFETLKTKYEQEMKRWESIIAQEEAAISKKTDAKEPHKLKQKLLSYENLESLDSHMIFRLIERIDVHQGTYAGKTKHQQVDIYFKFRSEQNKIQITL